MLGETDKPRWWIENEKLKAVLDLPPYEPPRFLDGTYTHWVVRRLEDEYDCDIRFIDVNPVGSASRQVRVDGEVALTVGNRRDDDGNTVYTMTAERFRNAIENEIA